MFSLLGRGQAPSTDSTPYVSIQLAIRIEIIARKFSMHFQCVPLIFRLAREIFAHTGWEFLAFKTWIPGGAACNLSNMTSAYGRYFPSALKISTSGNQTLECFIATLTLTGKRPLDTWIFVQGPWVPSYATNTGANRAMPLPPAGDHILRKQQLRSAVVGLPLTVLGSHTCKCIHDNLTQAVNICTLTFVAT